jgi:hypothetical protein
MQSAQFGNRVLDRLMAQVRAGNRFNNADPARTLLVRAPCKLNCGERMRDKARGIEAAKAACELCKAIV